ncbi:MAG: hypothetical protein Q9220_005541 [cf. Caloplaca sp. 1 TL-2023]
MRLTRNCLLTSILIAPIFSSPVYRRVDNQTAAVPKTFTVDQVASSTPPLPALQELYATYLKYNAQPPVNVSDLANTTQHSWVVAIPNDVGTDYQTPVTIGGQTINLQFDTGSSDLWIFSNAAAANAATTHASYNPRLSSTAKQLTGATWAIAYGDGSACSGDVYTDTVTVGQASYPHQAVELATTVDQHFVQGDVDGILGLASDVLNTVKPTPQRTFFTNILPSLSQPVFTVDLKRNAPGSFDFGFIDSSKYTGAITYVPTIDNVRGQWGFQVNSIAIGGIRIPASSFVALADTGTSLIYLPDALTAAYYASVPGASCTPGLWFYPCSSTATLPDLTFVIGSYEAVIPGSLLASTMMANHVMGSMCLGQIQSGGALGVSIVGDAFFNSQFVIFANGPPSRLGFANKVEEGEVATA